jgi:hypothetical protein
MRRGTLQGILITALALLAFGAPPAVASDCGQTTTVTPRRSLGPGAAPLAVGDSVLYDAAQALSYYGFETNAMVCRTMAQGIAYLQQHAQNLPVLVVVALGTNGSVTSAQIDQLLSIVGAQRILAMVTPHNGNYAYVSGLIRAAAQQHPGRIEVLDWDRLSAGHPSWFAPDGIHLGSSAGIDAYAQLVASALSGATAPASTPSGGQSSSSLANGVQPAPIGAPTTISPSTSTSGTAAGSAAPPKPDDKQTATLALSTVDEACASVSKQLML